MTSFNGPWSSDLDAFKKSVQSMPDQYKSSFAAASKSTLEKVCSPSVLHIWETDSDIDSLLQLTSVIAKLCDLGVRKNKGANENDGSMLIIAEESRSRNNFGRICQLVEYLTGADGKRHLEGTVAVFSKILIVRGWDNNVLSGQQEALEKTVKRVNTAVEQVLKMGGLKKIVWHHGAVLHFLLQWINMTTSTLRSALSAITVTGSLNLADRIAPSVTGRANKLPDLERLEQFAKKLNIPVVFLDTPSQLLDFEYLGTYVYYYAYYINTFLPTSLSRPHLYKAQDELVTFAFRLRAASEGRYGSDAVKMVQKHLDASKAKQWARTCVSKESYEKSKCRAAGKDEAIHHAVQLADSPFALLTHGAGVPAFARLAVGPASASAHEYYTAAPVNIAFTKSQIRPTSPATFHILIPRSSQDLEKVTNRVQGLMMAVLERVRQEKGNPVLDDTENGMWTAVVKACEWAIEGCNESKMPKGVAKKVGFVTGKLQEGTWGFALDPPKDGGKIATNSVAAVAAMPEPNRTYGFGQNTQQTRGLHTTYNGAEQQQQQQYMPQQGHGGGLSQFPMPSSAQGAAFAQQVPGQMPKQGMYSGGPDYGGGHFSGGQSALLPSHRGFEHGGRGGGYQQSMGGPW
ncbi:hypothetical protein BKA58DRAFT_317538 [Alternaria rosae]|uniref:uncharacterized protein n=1 Tax=Alternaria rosae TaxID=1187941 RepID=UPI001E8E4B18|nr:uncharacterized protein BKA58DRAFT_317538 [Alternaria rosae]KAH6868397.1 hypothetical protein BKA58DRAFT_317538 [Alternaria rosae]